MADRGNWIQTYTGRQFFPADPRPEDVFIEDIAHALSLQCRYAGHCREFYSVADHSLSVSKLLLPHHALWGLLHDASEAYLIDLPAPLKHDVRLGSVYREYETRIMRAICQRFDLPEEEPKEVKHADMVMCVTEVRDLMAPPPAPWPLNNFQSYEPREKKVIPLPPRAAEELFLMRFEALTVAA